MLKKLAAAAVFAALTATAVNAATINNNLTVGVTISPDCTAVSGGPLNFGTYGGLPVNINVATTVTVTCSGGTPYSVGLGAGLYASGDVAARKMKHSTGTETLNYTLSHIAYGGTNWDDYTTPGGAFPTAVWGQAGSGNHTVFGQLPAQTVTNPGAYSDTVVITVSY